jgi:hypothetical protein
MEYDVMHSSIEFIERKTTSVPGVSSGRNLTTIARVPDAGPVGLGVDMSIEINHRTYTILRINPIVIRHENNVQDCHITYQVHVEEEQ